MENTLYDQSFCAMVVLDKSNNLDYFNPAFATLVGRSARQVKKCQNILELFPGQEKIVGELIASAFSSGEIQLGPEMQVVTPKGEHSFVLKLVPQTAGEYADKVIALFNDRTVERSLYDKYRQKLADLKANHAHIIHADRLRAIGELTSNMAHEVNNPLTVAMGNAELMAFALENKNLETERENLNSSQRNLMEALTRIERIIQGMRQFAYKGETSKEYVALQDIVESSINFIRPILDNNQIKLSLKVPHAPILVLVDRLQMEQVLVNLLNNAKDALEGVASPQITIEVAQDRDSSMNLLRVTDNGPGIDPAIGNQIYESFFSTKPQGAGTGLGLPIAKRLVEAHQGTLEHVSRPGETTFTLTLPMIELSSFAEGTIGVEASDDSVGHKVMVIDNEVGVLNLIKNYLLDTPYRIIGSTGGENVLSLLSTMMPAMVITDLNMPGINGRQLAREIRKLHPHLPIAYMSSQEHRKDFDEDKETLGLTQFIAKPFNKERLLQAITSSLEE